MQEENCDAQFVIKNVGVILCSEKREKYVG
jgi:hypothetical protein